MSAEQVVAFLREQNRLLTQRIADAEKYIASARLKMREYEHLIGVFLNTPLLDTSEPKDEDLLEEVD